jgi:hypothetical protein
MLDRLWLAVSSRRDAQRAQRGSGYEDLVRKYAPGRSFADVGAMWRLHGANSFLAEEVGATQVTAFDAMQATDEYRAEHERRGSSVRLVMGDLHDPQTPERVGVHDVVWCTGLMYHAPSPLLALERLAAMAGEYLILGTKTVPEVPGLPGMTVFFPSLSDEERRAYSRLWGTGPCTPFDRDPVRSYANWWWGFTRSAFVGMLGLGWDVVETRDSPRGLSSDNLLVVAKRRP